MTRGKKTLYNKLVSSAIADNPTPLKRNTAIDDRRDVMAHRYYFHAIIQRLRYDDCLVALSREFFIQPDTIIKELHRRIDLINSLTENKTTTSELRRQYPWFNWVGRML